jgi:hypothetical protein
MSHAILGAETDALLQPPAPIIPLSLHLPPWVGNLFTLALFLPGTKPRASWLFLRLHPHPVSSTVSDT